MNKGIIIKVIVSLAVVWFIFSAGKTLYENWRVNKEVRELKNQITEFKKTNDELKDKILYYQSASYREKIARERFGLQKPGEQVVVIIPEKQPTETEEQKKQKTSNPQKWWDFFFGVDN